MLSLDLERLLEDLSSLLRILGTSKPGEYNWSQEHIDSIDDVTFLQKIKTNT